MSDYLQASTERLVNDCLTCWQAIERRAISKNCDPLSYLKSDHACPSQVRASRKRLLDMIVVLLARHPPDLSTQTVEFHMCHVSQCSKIGRPYIWRGMPTPTLNPGDAVYYCEPCAAAFERAGAIIDPRTASWSSTLPGGSGASPAMVWAIE